MQGHRGARGYVRLVEEATEVVGVAVQLVFAPLLRGTPPDVARDRPCELELMVAAPGEGFGKFYLPGEGVPQAPFPKHPSPQKGLP